MLWSKNFWFISTRWIDEQVEIFTQIWEQINSVNGAFETVHFVVVDKSLWWKSGVTKGDTKKNEIDASF